VTVDETLNIRLISLAKLLEQLPAIPAVVSPVRGPRADGLDDIADDRLRLFGARLRERLSAVEMDGEDALLLRLLLQDFTTAVGCLRRGLREVEGQLLGVEDTIRQGRRAVRLLHAHSEPNPPPIDA
jgi:hypothetical protein